MWQPGTVKRASHGDGAIGRSNEVRRIIRELQETEAHRYLIVRAARYETLLRAAPAAVSGIRGHILAFTDELVFHRRAALARTLTGVGSSLTGGAGGSANNTSAGPVRLAYKDIAEVQADGCRLAITLNSSSKDMIAGYLGGSAVDLFHPSPENSPSPMPGSAANSGPSSSKGLQGAMGKLGSSFNARNPPTLSRSGSGMGSIGRRLSRMGVSGLFNVNGGGCSSSYKETPVLVLDLESPNACGQMQVLADAGTSNIISALPYAHCP
jgi:hypothetical protein